jgi:hypothetical protein
MRQMKIYPVVSMTQKDIDEINSQPINPDRGSQTSAEMVAKFRVVLGPWDPSSRESLVLANDRRRFEVHISNNAVSMILATYSSLIVGLRHHCRQRRRSSI